jgi:hypothetical protein
MAFIKLTPTGCFRDRLRVGSLSGRRDLYPLINTTLFFFQACLSSLEFRTWLQVGVLSSLVIDALFALTSQFQRARAGTQTLAHN